ncbi:MAG TPA: hypothetical protein VIF43_03385 [Patescibacteria group bacterium]|jgi:hypothetical protein
MAPDGQEPNPEIPVGSRVVVFRSVDHDEKRAEVFGYGTYEGDFVMPAESQEDGVGDPNPRIRLEDGREVWGIECWWGTEEDILEPLRGAGYEVVEVSLEEHRASTTGCMDLFNPN